MWSVQLKSVTFYNNLVIYIQGKLYSIIVIAYIILQSILPAKVDSLQVDLCVNVKEVSSQQVTRCWTHNGCCVEDPWGMKDHRN